MANASTLPFPARDRGVFNGTSSLTRIERLVLGTLVGVALVMNVAMSLRGSDGVLTALFETLLTAAFALFIWVPRLAVLSFAAAIGMSFTFGEITTAALVAAAIAAGLVTRTCSRVITLAYSTALIVGLCAATLLHNGATAVANIVILLLGAMASAVGFLQRWSTTRAMHLSEELAMRAQQEEAVVRNERQRIADDLHDVIAHDLTIISMHARVLSRSSKADEQEQSQQAITSAAKKALADLRWMLGQMDVVQTESIIVDDLGSVITDTVDELRAAGWAVMIQGPDLTSESLPRPVVLGLTRIVREAAMNVLKHARPGIVRFRFTSDQDTVGLQIVNDLDASSEAPRFASGGYGTVRMAERVRQLGGEMEVGEQGDRWRLFVRLPRSIVPPAAR